MGNGIGWLVANLKNAGQDFEFYPTTRDMVEMIWLEMKKRDSIRTEFGNVLDIGCGTCNFKRWIEELNAEFEASEKARQESSYAKVRKAAAKEGRDRIDYSEYYHARSEIPLSRYFVIEKSRILIERLEPSTIVLGTDFNATTLLDKEADTIFCNPPYSEYETWMKRIIFEGRAENMFLIVPERWKTNESIAKAISETAAAVKVLGKSDFEDAERRARAKVDILYIRKRMDGENRHIAFDRWFDETYPMGEQSVYAYDECREERERLERELLGGKNKIEVMVCGYNEAMKTLDGNFRAITSLDACVLKDIGIEKKAVKEALKSKISGLKNVYWDAVFNNLDEITSRLTGKTREELKERFIGLRSVDFTAENIYSLIIWVIKNANRYFEKQLIDFFEGLSSVENVKPYKSNQRVFTEKNWRCWRDGSTEKPSHYTLDYRIVCSGWYFMSSYSWNRDKMESEKIRKKIGDFIAIARNLGIADKFDVDLPGEFGEKAQVKMLFGEKWVSLFDYRCYRNNNVHVQFNIEFTKAMNVEVARLLGWIHSAEDIKQEFPPELAKGAERYFNRNVTIDLGSVSLLPCAN